MEGCSVPTNYYYEGKLHRDPKDGPAVLWADGQWEYHFEGKKHRPRDEGPACYLGDAIFEYWVDGVLVRTVDLEM